jgi:molecular chaperone GrpE
MMDPELRDRLLQRFGQYLDSAPPGRDDLSQPEREIDLVTLFTELAALKNEVKLESRQVRRALEHSQELIDGLRESSQQVRNELTRRRQAQDEVRQAAEQPLLLELLELRDRIEAALSSVRDYRPGPLSPRRTNRFLAGVGEGMEISLRRLDGLLTRYGVRVLESLGRRLDPDTMQAVTIENRDDQEDGVVLAELRKGFLRAGEVLRLAEVVVNKRRSES